MKLGRNRFFQYNVVKLGKTPKKLEESKNRLFDLYLKSEGVETLET